VVFAEKVEYFTGSSHKAVARTDPIRRINLLNLKSSTDDPLLPLDSSTSDAFLSSPLSTLFHPDPSSTPSENDSRASELASSFMGPGPWTFSEHLALPNSCAQLRFSLRNRKANVAVSHVLKIVIRVQRGGEEALDPKTGRPKLYDIVVQTPVHILSVSFIQQFSHISIPI
jgi:arrestin-related trafficking adapter 3/6